ncbi:MAG: LuxR family transcriptional regulator, partial [Chloroflexi bacterium]|nr:LuxR family transcriptional regulator [Chloroflexota bacterium]
ECAALDRLLATVHEGRSGVLVLRGEAGIGKTALLDYAVGMASGCRVARVTGVESEMELTYAGLHRLCGPEMLHRHDRLPGPQRDALGSAFGLTTGAAPDRFLVGLAVLSLLADVAEEQPLLCVVEDAQWVDQASAQVLAIAARRLHAESVCMLFAIREPCAASQFEGLPELRVDGLPDRDARELLDSVTPGGLDARVRDRIVAETQGNPLALLELPRDLEPAELAVGFGVPGMPAVPHRIEESFTRRVEQLPAATRLLLLVSAADHSGEALLVWRAAALLCVGVDASAPAEADRLVKLDVRIAFRHPLVRSAVYGAASPDQRRTVHGALADAIDPGLDPERRAWHRAHAAAGPDEGLAVELERAADRAQARGSLVAAATLLERAGALTPDRARRVERVLTAAEAHLDAGSSGAASELLDAADVGLLDELGRARLERMRARIAFVTGRGRDAPPLLLSAARRLEPLDVRLARETYLEALDAAMFAGSLGGGRGVLEVAEAARAAPPAPEPPQASDLLLDGLAVLHTEGYAAGVPMLKRAVRAFLDGSDLRWLQPAVRTAWQLWDEKPWLTLATRAVEFARGTGALTALPLALTQLAGATALTGDLAATAAMIEEATSITTATGSPPLRHAEVFLAAWRGHELEHSALVEEMVEDAEARGEGLAITIIEYSTAILHNGLGNHGAALAAAQRACVGGETLHWALPELVEAAARSGRPELARPFLQRLSELAQCSGTDLALGLRACSLAFVAEGQDAEDLFREALDRLSRTRARPHLARAHLLYGEWLRAERRRLDARKQLRIAHEMFVSMGVNAFASRTARELLAAGECVPQPRGEIPGRLTAQEAHIALLANEGLSNPQIGARLFLSTRTVEYHLGKVFTKLGIGSRTELGRVLPTVAGAAVQAGRRQP